MRIGQSKAWQTIPDKILYAEGLYAVDGPSLWTPDDPSARDPEAIDRIWTRFEVSVAPTIERLERGEELEALTWLRSLVPWVASIFVRGQEFTDRFNQRLPVQAAGVDSDRAAANANEARLLELQRLLAPVAAAQWQVIHAPVGASYINNDVNMAPCIKQAMGGQPTAEGWTIPMSRRLVLHLFPRPVRDVMYVREDGTWMAYLEHHHADFRDVHRTNSAVSVNARELILGSDSRTVQRYGAALGQAMKTQKYPLGYDPMDGWGQVPSSVQREHEFDWHRLCTLAAQPVGERATIEVGAIDWEAANVGVVILPTNRGMGAHGLRLRFDPLRVTLDLTVRPELLPELAASRISSEEWEKLSQSRTDVFAVQRSTAPHVHPLGAGVNQRPVPLPRDLIRPFPDFFQPWRDAGWLAESGTGSSAIDRCLAT